MKEYEEMNLSDLENVGGGAGKLTADSWATVSGLEASTLALRKRPEYDYSNIMQGCSLSNGDRVQIQGSPVLGDDGRTYVKVYSPKSGKTGYVNAQFLI